MNLIKESAAPKNQEDAIVIKLWEVYLLYHSANLYKTLTDSSLDNGPFEQLTPGRVAFRFSKYEWADNIKNLLYEHRIPVVIQSNHLQAVKARGRRPSFRGVSI